MPEQLEPLSVPISALEHYAYCSRQAALIHVDAYFDSTVDTVRGDLAHAAVDRVGVGHGRDRRRLFRSLLAAAPGGGRGSQRHLGSSRGDIRR
jgi:hypothetical protein